MLCGLPKSELVGSSNMLDRHIETDAENPCANHHQNKCSKHQLSRGHDVLDSYDRHLEDAELITMKVVASSAHCSLKTQEPSSSIYIFLCLSLDPPQSRGSMKDTPQVPFIIYFAAPQPSTPSAVTILVGSCFIGSVGR